jgi:hypothetical protein
MSVDSGFLDLIINRETGKYRSLQEIEERLAASKAGGVVVAEPTKFSASTFNVAGTHVLEVLADLDKSLPAPAEADAVIDGTNAELLDNLHALLFYLAGRVDLVCQACVAEE